MINKEKKILDIQTILRLLVRYFESKLLTNDLYLSVKSDRKSKGSVIFQFKLIRNLKFNNCCSEIIKHQRQNACYFLLGTLIVE